MPFLPALSLAQSLTLQRPPVAGWVRGAALVSGGFLLHIRRNRYERRSDKGRASPREEYVAPLSGHTMRHHASRGSPGASARISTLSPRPVDIAHRDILVMSL